MTEGVVHERTYTSGERVTAGVYRDLLSGARVTLFEDDELPHDHRIMRFPRLFAREDEREVEQREPCLAAR